MYSWLPNRVEKAAITNDGTPMVKKITTNKIGYSRQCSKFSFYRL